MIEIALCLAIIGFALVSILLVLPSGMNTQRDTREQTIVGQDATELIEAIRNGARGYDDLTNYVVSITNNITDYSDLGKVVDHHTAVYTYTSASYDVTSINQMALTNGLRIIGLLSTPEYTTAPQNGSPVFWTNGMAYTSNHIAAVIRSFSGLAAEKPPQNNDLMQEDTFAYRLIVVNAPLAADGSVVVNAGYAQQLEGNLHDLRLLFEWPELPNGDVGNFRQTYRAEVAGQLVVTNYGSLFSGIQYLYFYQPNYFTPQ